MLILYAILTAGCVTISFCGETNELYGGNNESIASYNIETFIVSEFTLEAYHSEETANYLATLVKLANDIFRIKTLDIRINLSISSMMLLNESYSKNWIYENSKMKSLQRSCYFAGRLTDFNGKSFKKDLTLIFTRKQFGAEGYSTGGGAMCDGKRSCSLIQDVGYKTALVIVHEISHLLGLDHDDECFPGASANSIMAETIKSTFTNYQWTNCSQTLLEKNIGNFSCLTDASLTNVSDDDCIQVTGRNNTACPWNTNINKACSSGICVTKISNEKNLMETTPENHSISNANGVYTTLSTTPAEPQTDPPEPRPGYKWIATGWSSCSSTCGGGVTYPQYQCIKNGQEVSNQYCNRDGFTPRGKECNTKPCGKNVSNDRIFVWKTGSWSECRRKHRKMQQTRIVKCTRLVNGKKKSVNKSNCKKSEKMPSKNRNCRILW